MKLIIAEKPSVAQSIAAAFGIKKRMNGYLEGNGCIVSWCLGHLAGLASADSYDAKYAKWKREDLPIVPSSWCYTLSSDKTAQFEILRELMQRADVTEVVNACDAGREGELIFRTVYYLAGCTKTMKRLWISSMEDDAIRMGFENLKPGRDFDGLYQSALCRSKADWLVGINATRLFSTAYHRTLNVGRVMSPTLALIVQREAEIAAFHPEPFYTVNLMAGGVTASGEKLKDKSAANKLADECSGQPVTVKSVERKEKSEKAPALYDLTTLQRDANRLLGYTAQQTLDYLQSLYEKKLCTYPRTDSRFLTDDMEASVPAVVSIAAGICEVTQQETIQSHQVCNNGKVSDHHAVIPTIQAGKADTSVLPSGEREILRLIAMQLLRAVSDAHRYAETIITLECAGYLFTAKGKTVLSPGWKQYMSTEQQDNPLPELTEGVVIDEVSASVKEGKTTPPKHYTEDTLLSAMETAGKEEMPDDAERKGLGTPATRAAILEKLVAAGFVERRKSKKTANLVPAGIGTSLITILPEQLQSPLLTAEWEQKLKEIECGELSPEVFMDGITEMLADLIETYQPMQGAEVLFPSGREVIGKCPRCGGDVTESKKGFFCEKNDCRFGLWRDNKFFTSKHAAITKKIAAALLKDGKVRMKGLYSERTGKEYDATVVLEDTDEQVRFKLVFDGKEGK